MKILYHQPSLFTVSAGRTIYAGYRNAFLNLGHQFETLTADSDQRKASSYRLVLNFMVIA